MSRFIGSKPVKKEPVTIPAPAAESVQEPAPAEKPKAAPKRTKRKVVK